MNRHLLMFIIHTILAMSCLSLGLGFWALGQYYMALLCGVATAIPIVCGVNAYNNWLRS